MSYASSSRGESPRNRQISSSPSSSRTHQTPASSSPHTSPSAIGGHRIRSTRRWAEDVAEDVAAESVEAIEENQLDISAPASELLGIVRFLRDIVFGFAADLVGIFTRGRVVLRKPHMLNRLSPALIAARAQPLHQHHRRQIRLRRSTSMSSEHNSTEIALPSFPRQSRHHLRLSTRNRHFRRYRRREIMPPLAAAADQHDVNSQTASPQQVYSRHGSRHVPSTMDISPSRTRPPRIPGCYESSPALSEPGIAPSRAAQASSFLGLTPNNDRQDDFLDPEPEVISLPPAFYDASRVAAERPTPSNRSDHMISEVSESRSGVAFGIDPDANSTPTSIRSSPGQVLEIDDDIPHLENYEDVDDSSFRRGILRGRNGNSVHQSSRKVSFEK